jgi:hypothetical protein
MTQIQIILSKIINTKLGWLGLRSERWPLKFIYVLQHLEKSLLLFAKLQFRFKMSELSVSFVNLE